MAQFAKPSEFQQFPSSRGKFQSEESVVEACCSPVLELSDADCRVPALERQHSH